MMKRIAAALFAVASVFAMGCQSGPRAAPAGGVIGEQMIKTEDGRLTPEGMWSLGYLGDCAVSPDGKQIAYTVSYCDVAQNKKNAEIYLMSSEGQKGGTPMRLTETPDSEFNIAWKDNATLLFCRGSAIVRMDIKSRKETVVAQNERGFEGFKISSDGSKLVYVSTVPRKRPSKNDKLYEGLDRTTARVNEDLMYRHWDTWVDDYPHIFLVNLSESGKADISKAVDLVGADSPFECPMRPFSGIEQFSFSQDGSKIAYTCERKSGKDYTLSTNSDIYIYDIKSGSTANVSEGMMGYDQNPVFSHDGTKVAWESMEHEGHEGDKLRLIVYDFKTGSHTDCSAGFDYNVSGIQWTADDSELLGIVEYRGSCEIFAFSGAAKPARQLTKRGLHNITAFAQNGNSIYAVQQSRSRPSEIYLYSLADKEAEGTKLSGINDGAFSKLRMGKVEEHWIKSTDGKDMLVWVIYPYNYDPSKKYPALLYCEGGPGVMVGQAWSMRWNLQVLSSGGYIIMAPNRRGCPGFGTAWSDEVAGDFAGLCMQDYFQTVKLIPQEVKTIDTEHIGACGPSFGGFSVYWLAGHNEDHIFKAFLAHDGIFNLEQLDIETDELWSIVWNLGGHYWEKDNPVVLKNYAESPHKFVDKWNTPICVIHNELDYRIVASQGMAAYNAAKLRGLDARYLYFPDENHWVLKPQNSVFWYRNFFDWFDTYLK